MASPENDSQRHTVSALFGLIGGALAVIGFFLPWYASSKETISGWDFVSIYLLGKASFAPAGTSSAPTALPLAFLYALPLLLALVALVTGIIGLSAKNSPIFSGLYGATGVVGLSNYQMSSIGGRFAFSANYPGTTGLGLLLLDLGYF